jgi:hypothetical protein
MIEALEEIIEDMRDLSSDEIRKEYGKGTKGLKSDKKRKMPKESGYTMIIEMAMPKDKKKGMDEDDDITKKILGL